MDKINEVEGSSVLDVSQPPYRAPETWLEAWQRVTDVLDASESDDPVYSWRVHPDHVRIALGPKPIE